MATQAKDTKEEASYQAHPMGRQACDRCTMFVPPTGCTTVKGIISRRGWCKYWKQSKEAK